MAAIAIVVAPEPRTYSVVNLGNPAFALALVGGIFAAADQDQKQAKLSAALRAERFSVRQTLGATLAARLAANGYRTRIVDGAWQEKDGRYLLRTDLIADGADGADAVLVVTPVSAGFVAPAPASDYVPAVTVHVRLLGADGRTELYRAIHAAGWQPGHTSGWRFTPASQHFGDFQALMEKPAVSAEALAASAAAVAASIAKDLVRP